MDTIATAPVSAFASPTVGLTMTQGRIMTTLQVFDEKLRRPVADARLASISFVSAKEFAGVPADQRIPKLRSMADAVFTAAVIGSFIVVRDKKSVIELVLEDRQSFSNARLELAKAADEARGILEVISSAERRLAAAFATIESNNSATKA